ncbi:MAG TPA: carboxypeptidase-like regulatory domain-containing protein [Bryobacteraceae bacterium]|nr:carboxypeptidase-like regulatory domain-containing protein [Bryobacteraceae bacterium]
MRLPPREVQHISRFGKRVASAFIAPFVLLLTIPLIAQLETRTVTGRVMDARGNMLPGAVVQLENTETLVVRSYITQRDGVYHFTGLSSDVDYEVRAHYKTHWSNRRIISKFDSPKKSQIDLTIPID